jgi:GT2 family glycosyltransferase
VTAGENIVSSFRRGREDSPGGVPVAGAGISVAGLTVVVCTYRRAESMIRFVDSLSTQTYRPFAFIVVDASPDAATETALQAHPQVETLATMVEYYRVTGPLKGLTRQRNFAIARVRTELVAFFDDDIVLRPACLQTMVAAHDAQKDVVGVSAYVENAYEVPSRQWKIRRMLGIVPDLHPGRYHRSGHSISWNFLPPTDAVVPGDWLPGGITMWKTDVIRDLGFWEHFSGYAQGEDLEFSLRAGRRGRLVVAGAARLLHLQDAGGRPNQYQMGYMAIYNRYHIHRRGLANRTWRDVLWFAYGYILDSIILSRRLFFPGETRAIFDQLRGRCAAAVSILLGR